MTGHGALEIWAVIVVVGVATYLIRLSFIYLFGQVNEVPPRVKLFLSFVPAAVLAALVAPQLITVGSTVEETLVDERLFAGVVAGAVAWWTEDILATIVAGMVALWTIQFLLF